MPIEAHSGLSPALRSGEGAALPIPPLRMRAGGSDATAPGGAEAPQTFGQALLHALGEVNQAQLHAGQMTTRFAAGEPLDVHEVMIASQQAGVALNLSIQVRNKLLEAYQELTHINI